MSATVINAGMVNAIKVQFLKTIFEDDFVEKGMTAWLTDVEWDEKDECYKLYFDFTEFEAINEKYFKQLYHANKFTEALNLGRRASEKYTAKEAGYYNTKYSVYYNPATSVGSRNDEAFAADIRAYLRVVE